MTFDLWEESVGPKPKVTAYERPDRGLAVYLRWYENGKRREKRADVGSVRDRRGRLRASSQKEALREAEDQRELLMGGGQVRKVDEPLTLEDGVRRAFSVRGPYPLDPDADSYTRQTRAHAKLGIDLLGGPSMLWEEVTPGMVRSVWRKLARETGGKGGHNKAEKVVGALFKIAGWLQAEDPDGRYPRPWSGWRGELRAHWKKLGADLEKAQPRYKPEEVRALWKHLPEADPRLRLALMLGMELRGGQLVRSFRKDLTRLDDGSWRLAVPYASERKRAPVLHLSEPEAAALESAMADGYLSELVSAHEQGVIEDYALFPAGMLKEGRVPVVRADKAMDRGTLVSMIHKLEEAAGVPHVKGRAWHGLRRSLSDLWESVTDDERLKDMAGGWVAGSEMRRGIYQERESEALRAQVSALRGRLRDSLKDGE